MRCLVMFVTAVCLIFLVQFSGVKRLVDEEPFQDQNQTDCPEIFPCLNKVRPALYLCEIVMISS